MAELNQLQEAIRNPAAIGVLGEYLAFAENYLGFLDEELTAGRYRRAGSPINPYIFFEAKSGLVDGLTRPVNGDLFISDLAKFRSARAEFEEILRLITKERANSLDALKRNGLHPELVDSVLYTAQLSIGCTADTFESPNQSRKRVGQLFEYLIRRLINEVGIDCGEGTVGIPTGFPGPPLKYQMDLIFPFKKPSSRGLISLAEGQVVGSVKTDSKDRLEQLFVEKFLMTKLLGRKVPFTAIFLHDVQRAVRAGSPLGINSTFLSNKFACYRNVLTDLDGVYYVDPRPSMLDPSIGVRRFHDFIIGGLWDLTR